MKKYHFVFLLLIFCVFSTIFAGNLYAASAMIEFSAANKQVQVGERVSVVCTVTASAGFSDADFYITYDNKILKFEAGGDKISAEGGTLHVASTGNTDEVGKRVFSLTFLAKKKGNAAIAVSRKAQISTTDGVGLSVSSNRITLNVTELDIQQKKEETPPPPTATAVSERSKSKNARLSSLGCSGLKNLNPGFDRKILQYETVVDCDTDTLYFTFQTASKKATVLIEGNEALKQGINEARITVKAEAGNKKVYRITVKKESEKETKEREWDEKSEGDGVDFHVFQQNGKTIIKNSYEFLVLDVTSETTIPSGYVKTKIRIDGVEIPAYTMESDMENNFLLLYLKGPSGEQNVYQYDRSEKTLQRYTGDMIERINKSGQDGYVMQERTDESTKKQVVLFVVIIVLVIMVLCMMGYILKLIGKNRNIKKKTHYDDLDF